jgi:hypothetical protein
MEGWIIDLGDEFTEFTKQGALGYEAILPWVLRQKDAIDSIVFS